MKLKSIFAVLPVFLIFTCFSQTISPTCGQGYYYKIGGCLSSYGTGSGTLTGYTQNFPGNAQGLALAPAFGFSAPDPTYWTVVNGIYYYYNGTSFASSGHSAGGNAFTNPGGSKDYIYNIDSQGNVSVYDGTANATILTTFSSLTSTNVVQDIVGDDNNNFYLVRRSSPAALMVFDHTGVNTCTYAISVPSGTANGLAITNNKLLIGDENTAYRYELQGETMVYTGNDNLTPCAGTSNDLASCPTEVGLFSAITSTPGSLTCTLTSIALTSGDANGSATYMWSGPGISGASNNQSITVTAPGVYTRVAVNCAGLTSTMYHTVQYDSTPPPMSVYQAATLKCAQDPAVMLTAGGLFSSYKWSPSASLSGASTSIVYANPSVTTTYSVTGYVNGCERTAVMTVSANPLTQPVITATSDSICSGNAVSLAVPASLNYEWQPGSLQGNTITVTPLTNTEFTVTGTDELGCKTTSTQKIAVVEVPTLNSSVSKSAICENESVTLSNTGAEKYSVSPGNYSGSSLVLNPLSTTIYTVTGSNWNCAVTRTISVNVNKLPVITASATNTLVCAGDAVEVTASGAQTYSWDDQAGAQTHVFYPSVNSGYKITGVDGNGCKGELMLSITVNECTGITDASNEDVYKIYPNPAHSFLNIEARAESAIVEVYDLQGRLLLNGSLEKGSNRISLQNFDAGLYLVQIRTNTSTLFTTRVVVQ